MEASNTNQDLSEEDLTLKNRLESYVTQLLPEPHNPALQKLAVESLKQEMIASYNINDSLIDVIKLQKFITPHYNTLKHYFHTKINDTSIKKLLADILSVLATLNNAEPEKREILKYRLLGSQDDFTKWELEYVKKLSIQVMEEFEDPILGYSLKVLWYLTEKIVAFYMKNKLEIEAADFLVEIDHPNYIPLREGAVRDNYRKICLYITSLARFLTYESISIALNVTAYHIYMDFEDYASALRMASLLPRLHPLHEMIFDHCDDLLQRKQLCFMVARGRTGLKIDGYKVGDEQERKELQEIINNMRMSQGYLDLARDVGVMEPKSPEDVYKGSRNCGVTRDLGDVIVNAFVNAGFGKDEVMVGRKDRVLKIKGGGKMSEVASLGVIMLWQVDEGFKELQRHLECNNDDHFVKGGALLGMGILNSSVKHDSNHQALKLVFDCANEKDEDRWVRIGAIMGLGLSYVASEDKLVAKILIKIMEDQETTLDLAAFAAISLGLVYLGANLNQRAANAINFALIQQTMKINEFILKYPDDCAASEGFVSTMRLLCLGLGLLYLGKMGQVRQALHILQDLNENMRLYCDICLHSLAYIGSGDVELVQCFLSDCNEEPAAVLGIAMMAVGEELSVEMGIRFLEHLLMYGEQNTRKTVPLALSLLCISNPERGKVVDILSSLTHDCNTQVVMSAIISLGLVGSGTNNAMIAEMLRNLTRFYSHDDDDDEDDHDNDDDVLLCIQIAQGLLHLGKGLLTLNPYYSDGLLLSPVGIAGIVIFLNCYSDSTIMLGFKHLLLYFLVLAMQPRMLLTVDENLKMIHVPVHVGQAVDVVGQAGRPRGITGFQTFETPVLLGSGERAELCTDKFVALTPILEGFVILKHK